jgi:hypothetical protein
VACRLVPSLPPARNRRKELSRHRVTPFVALLNANRRVRRQRRETMPTAAG